MLKYLAVIAVVATLAACDPAAMEQEQSNDAPSQVKVGQAFTHDKYDVAKGWTVKRDVLGDAALKNMQVTNTSDSSDTPMFTLDFNKDKRLLFTVECTANELQAGATTRMNCFSTGNYRKGYTSVTVRDMW